MVKEFKNYFGQTNRIIWFSCWVTNKQVKKNFWNICMYVHMQVYIKIMRKHRSYWEACFDGEHQCHTGLFDGKRLQGAGLYVQGHYSLVWSLPLKISNSFITFYILIKTSYLLFSIRLTDHSLAPKYSCS